MKNWLVRAFDFLKASLEPPRHELNELDWKAALSPDKKRLSEHLSALANLPGGGFLVFGVNNAGKAVGVDEATIETTINKLANIGRDALEPPMSLDHAVETFGAARVLFVHVPESTIKPVHLRGKSLEHAFIRSGGTTRTASRQEIGVMMLHSRTPRWEELHASTLLSDEEMMARLNVEPIFNMLERPLPTSPAETMIWMAGENFVNRVPGGGGYQGKAMVVSIDKLTTLRMYEKVRAEWEAEKARVLKALDGMAGGHPDHAGLLARTD